MLELLILSVGLAMDAFAVALVRGSVAGHRPLLALETGAAFGLAQGLMPLIGWSLGLAFADMIAAVDHWVAFVLLGFLGGRMIAEALTARDEAEPSGPKRSYHVALAMAAFATSIDAAAAGLTLPLLATTVFVSCLTIGGVTAILSVFAYEFGNRIAPGRGKIAEIFGGIVLIGLGTKILVEHLTA